MKAKYYRLVVRENGSDDNFELLATFNKEEAEEKFSNCDWWDVYDDNRYVEFATAEYELTEVEVEYEEGEDPIEDGEWLNDETIEFKRVGYFKDEDYNPEYVEDEDYETSEEADEERESREKRVKWLRIQNNLDEDNLDNIVK